MLASVRTTYIFNLCLVVNYKHHPNRIKYLSIISTLVSYKFGRNYIKIKSEFVDILNFRLRLKKNFNQNLITVQKL